VTERHLDDEQLSALLDGDSADHAHRDEVDATSGPAHVDACATCGERLEALRGAREAVATSPVAPLPASVLDDLVGRAVAAAPHVDPAIVPLSRARRRVPPPAWLVGAAAALLALVGVAGALRAVTDRGPDAGSMALTARDNEGAAESQSQADKSAAQVPAPNADAAAGAVASGGATSGGDPDVVSFDLADQHDPSELGLLLRDRPSSFSAAATAARAAGGDGPTTAMARSTARAAAPSSADRAQCRSQAEASGADALGALLSTGTVRWDGQPAEVLVFALRSPSEGVTRQAMVLRRPGCQLLAEQRF
jgi:hypothetical protein